MSVPEGTLLWRGSGMAVIGCALRLTANPSACPLNISVIFYLLSFSCTELSDLCLMKDVYMLCWAAGWSLFYPCSDVAVGEAASEKQGAEVCFRAAAHSVGVACVLSRGCWALPGKCLQAFPLSNHILTDSDEKRSWEGTSP